MRLVRICSTVIGLALGAIVVAATGASAASPCPPGQPYGRPPGKPPNQPGPPAGRPPQYPPGKCQLQLGISAARAGASVSASGDGFQPGTSVTLSFGSARVSSATADGSGQMSQTFTVPPAAQPGQFAVRAAGTGADGTPYEQGAVFEVLAPQPGATTAAPSSPAVLRPGAGLAAASSAGAPGQVVIPMPGGGFTTAPVIGSGMEGGSGVLQADGSVTGVGAEQSSALPGSTGAAPLGSASPGITGAFAVGSSSSSGALLPVAGVGGGVILLGVGAGTVVAVKRRKSAKA